MLAMRKPAAPPSPSPERTLHRSSEPIGLLTNSPTRKLKPREVVLYPARTARGGQSGWGNSISKSQVGARIGQHRGGLKPQGGGSLLETKPQSYSQGQGPPPQSQKPEPGRVLQQQMLLRVPGLGRPSNPNRPTRHQMAFHFGAEDLISIQTSNQQRL